MNKKYFFNEKLIASASIETLCNVSLMSKILLSSYPEKIKGDLCPLIRALVHNLCSNSLKVRSCTISEVRQIISASKGVEFVRLALSEFDKRINLISIQTEGENSVDQFGTPTQAYVEALQVLTSLKEITHDESIEVAMDLLLISNHPAIVLNNPFLWENIIETNFQVYPKDLILTKKRNP